MLTNTFQHINGIGPKKEKQLWAKGIHNWNAAGSIMNGRLAESLLHLGNGNPLYFENHLPSSLHWRFFPEFRKDTVYLDIETDGGDSCNGTITSIAMYDGSDVFYYVHGKNLDDFPNDILKYKVIVTYNGRCFDVPFIQNYFGITLNHAQIDLRYVLAALGYKGGLKKCEKALGIDRGELDGVDGYFAVLLWKDYQYNQNTKALETLLAYNIEDTVNLENLMVQAYNMNIEKTPFAETLRIDLPYLPDIPFHPDMETVHRIRSWYAEETRYYR